MTARPPSFRKLIKRLTCRPGDLADCVADKPADQETMPTLAEAIVGADKSAVIAVLGPPRSAVASGSELKPSATYWQASTWYYPVPRNEQMGMAINFEDDCAGALISFRPGPPESRSHLRRMFNTEQIKPER